MGYYINYDDLLSHFTTRQRLSHGTIVTRLSRIRIFYQWREAMKKPLTSQVVEDFFFYLKETKKISNSSLNTYYHALISLQKYLTFRKLSKKFMIGLQPFKGEDPDIIPLTLDEIKLLKHYKETKYTTAKEMVDFLIDTGSRWEDVQAFQVKSVDITGRQISYVQLKNGLRRNVYIEEPLLSILNNRITGKKREELVFINTRGGVMHYPDFYQYLKHLALTVGITKRVSPHILRHSYAQNLYEQTGDIYLLKDVLGHKSITSTLRYLRNSKKRVRQAQQMHPHIAENVSALIRIDILQKEIEKQGIEEDEKFDPLKVKKAINEFLSSLYSAVKADIELQKV